MKQVNGLLKWLIACLMLIFIFAIASACQPTPTDPVVVDRREFQEKVEQAAPASVYDAPSTWRETLDMRSSSATVEIDAAVRVPGVTSYPAYRVEQIAFSNETVQAMLDCFVRSNNAVALTEPTKGDINKQILIARKNGRDSWADSLEEDLDKAPESAPMEPIKDWTLTSDRQQIYGGMELSEGEYATILLSANTVGYDNGLVWEESSLRLNGQTVGEVGITEEAAITSAKSMLGSFGLTDVVVYSIEKALAYPMDGYWFAADTEVPLWKGYSIRFVRTIGGISARDDEGVTESDGDEYEYTAPFYIENIQMGVDEGGSVQWFSWTNPTRLTEKVSDNVILLPFEEVQEKVRKLLFFTYAYRYDAITVKRVEMKMTMIGIKDRPGEAMYVPAWFIYSTVSHPWEAGTEEGDTPDTETIVINAVDGGRILEHPAHLDAQATLIE
jgi:hypothetical protein